MKQQLSKLFADTSVSQIFSALGYFSTDKAVIENHLKGIHGHEVKVITREEFEAMPDDEKEPKRILTLEEQLAKRNSKGIQEMIEKQSGSIKKQDEIVAKIKAQGDKMDANKFQAAKESLEKMIEDLTKMEEVCEERKIEEAIYEEQQKVKASETANQ